MFRGYLEEAFSKKLPSFFLVISPDPYDRKKIIDLICRYLPHKNTYSVERLSAKDDSVLKMKSQLDAPSLFGGDPLIIYEDVESIKKSDIKELSKLLKGSIFGYLLCGAKIKPSNLADFEKAGVVLDLTYEKIWEKHKRFAELIVSKCAQAKKSISPEAVESFLDQAGFDRAQIEQEIEKLITYVGDKLQVEVKDVEEVIVSIKQHTLWQIAEKIIWGDRDVVFEEMDMSFFHGLLAALRFQLQLGLKIASIQETDEEGFDRYQLPRMNPKVFQLRKEIAAVRKSYFFKNALTYLYEIDLLSKNQVNYPQLLMDFFISKLSYMVTHEIEHEKVNYSS